MAPTPCQRTTPGYHHQQQHQTPSKTPQSKQRLQLPNPKNATATPLSAGAVVVPTEHPVEVIGRVRNYPDNKERLASVLEISGDGRTVRVRTDAGYRDFSLDGVSVAEDEGLEGFYRRFVGSRVEGVRLGATCTIMMYGPTGSGKSHTMFGCAKEPGIVYRALRDILNGGDEERAGGAVGNGVENDTGIDVGLFVQVAVLEIYNEEIYDLLSGNSGVAGGGSGASTMSGVPKGNAPKVRLEVMGKKAKNATYITGTEPGKISREVAKVEKRRIVKSTLCNERSSRSHCLIILEVPSVGGRLMLVDMAGSENIEAAGQIGFEAKMQTAKINQGNIALKRVVESIANGDSHVPFRDSKLTMLLQDSFEDDKSKILMILCASPDPKEMHKTISTLEYGAKAKCIVRVANMPSAKEKLESEESSTLLRSRLLAMNQFICKLQSENKIKVRECEEAHKELLQKDQNLAELRAKLQLIEGRGSAIEEEEIKLKVEQRTATLRVELMKMEEKMLQQQKELSILRRRLEEVELERCKLGEDALSQIHGGRFMKRVEALGGDQGMEKSMDLDMGDQPNISDVKEIREDASQFDSCWKPSSPNPCLYGMEEEEGDDDIRRIPEKILLSTVYEEEEEDGEDGESARDEVDKLVLEETLGHAKPASFVDSENFDSVNDTSHGKDTLKKSPKDASSARKARIQNIFRLCGNHRELAHQVILCTPPRDRHAGEKSIQLYTPVKRDLEEALHSEQQPLLKTLDYYSDASGISSVNGSLQLADEQNSIEGLSKKRHSSEVSEDKENSMHGLVPSDDLINVFVKWEASRELSGGSSIRKQKISRASSLADLRKLIEANHEEDDNSSKFTFLHLRKLIEANHEEDDNSSKFTFLLLGDPSGAPVAREKEVATPVSKLPICNDQANGYLACLRPHKKATQLPNHVPLGSLENTLKVVGLKTLQFGEALSPKLSQLDTSVRV